MYIYMYIYIYKRVNHTYLEYLLIIIGIYYYICMPFEFLTMIII